jgi:cytoskeleton protein RodZ
MRVLEGGRALHVTRTIAGTMTKVTRLTLDSSGGLERRRLHLREIAEADTPLETVGQDLRKARQCKGEDLAQIAAILKIRKGHLEALEESEFDALPGKTYTVGFVRAYASYLGLDGVQCVERLKAEIAGRIEGKDGSGQVSVPEEQKLPQGWLVLAAVLLVAIAYGGYYFITSANRAAVPATQAVPARLQAAAAPPAAAPAPAAAPESPAPAPEPSVAAAPPPAPVVVTPPAPQPLPEGQRLGLQNTGSRITLRAHREVRVDVVGPNNRTFLARVLRPGDTYRVPNFPGIVLTAPDAGAVEVLVDGTSMGYAGQDGAVADRLPLEGRNFANRQGQTG